MIQVHRGVARAGRFFLPSLLGILTVTCSGEHKPPGRSFEAGVGPPAPSTEPVIRVGVTVGDSLLPLSGTGRWAITEEGRPRPIAVVDGGPAWAVVRLPFETVLRVRRPDGFLSEAHVGPLRAEPLGPGALALNGSLYAGDLEFQLRPDGTLTAVNVLPLEGYVEGVVASELGRPGPAAWEAQRAQAVAARTYALKRLGSRSGLGFDVYGSMLDQAYAGLPDPADSMAVRAVRSTRGETLLYRGYLIDAYYHSTCGGSTARVELVFDDPPAPYLVPVSDKRSDGGYWCQESRYFRWTISYTAEELQATLERNLPGLVPLPVVGVGTVLDVQIVGFTPEGRALAVQVITSTGRYPVRKNEIRKLFADADGRLLRSTRFLLRPTYRGAVLDGLSLVGGGWGHGVGMCQVGALARAAAGQGYRKILSTYYPGTEVVPLYP